MQIEFKQLKDRFEHFWEGFDDKVELLASKIVFQVAPELPVSTSVHAKVASLNMDSTLAAMCFKVDAMTNQFDMFLESFKDNVEALATKIPESPPSHRRRRQGCRRLAHLFFYERCR